MATITVGVNQARWRLGIYAGVIATVSTGRDAQFVAVLARSSLLVDGLALGGREPSSVRLADGAVVEVLPPFAGG